MTREFALPDVGEGIAEGELIEWHVTEGDAVEEDQVIAEVETDKAVVDVPSPVDGTVVDLRADEGDVVPVGDVIAVFDVDGEPAAESERAGSDAGGAGADDALASSADSADADEGLEPAISAVDESAPDAGDDAEVGAVASGQVFAPPSVRRLARELDVSLEAVEGSGVSGRVTKADVRAHAEGVDATSSPRSNGETAASGAGIGGQDTASSATPATEPTVDERRDVTLATPEVRRLAEERGIDLDVVPASEQRDGHAFVTAADLEAYERGQQDGRDAGDGTAGAVDVRRTADETDEREAVREPYRGVRRSIGQTMAESKFTAPHVTHFDEIDVTDLVEIRSELADAASEEGVTLTYTPFVLKACVEALREHPILNAELDEENEEIVKKQVYNIGVATATDAGLMVPVVDDVDEKGLLDLAAEMNDLVAKARDRSIAPEEMQGGTFTVTNTGAIGGEFGTPILNPPESGILALGAIKKKPRVVTAEDGTDSIEPRHVMTVSLSFDHRIVDGADAARFTNTLSAYLENPERLLLTR